MLKLRLENSVIENRYLILRRIRCGSYTELFLGRDGRSDETVIIKTMNAEMGGARDRGFEERLIHYFQTEAEVLDRLEHPHIIRRLGHGIAADVDRRVFYYLVLEYMPGGDLMAVCQGKPLSLAVALGYCHQVCLGLAHAHRHGIIHRDIKPQNLLLDAQLKHLKISDFGIAKMIRGGAGEVTRGIGTETYAPPESFGLQHTEAALTPSADVYSLAKTLYVMLTGESPREFYQHPITRLPLDANTHAWVPKLGQVLHRATRHDPEERYATVDAFWHDLEALGRESGSLELSAPDEATVIAVKVSRAKFSRPAKREVVPPAVRVEVPIQPSRDRVGPDKPVIPAPQPSSGGVAKPATAVALRPWARRVFVIALAASFVACSFWVHSILSGGLKTRNGVVTAENLNLRAGPSESFPSYGWIQKGSPVMIIRRSQNGRWFEVEAPYWDWGDQALRRRRGWVSQYYIRLDEEDRR